MNPKRIWTEADRAAAERALHGVRADLRRLCARAPLQSAEYAALGNVMMVAADALRVFGGDVTISLARSERERRASTEQLPETQKRDRPKRQADRAVEDDA
ncbi:MAG: hypothetical protein B7Z30_00555 [Rhizobiales bacterium 12-68-15]|nr:MAG: hypothetical protein B7Z30_00555 [Rhizobiales bacterium 12-68-15]